MSPNAFQVAKASWMFIPGVAFVPGSGVPATAGSVKNRFAKSVSTKYSNTPSSVPPSRMRVRRM
jgi:hypothetical protein